MKTLVILLSKICSSPVHLLQILEIMFKQIPSGNFSHQLVCLSVISIITKFTRYHLNCSEKKNIHIQENQNEDGDEPSNKRKTIDVIFVDSDEESLFQRNNLPICPPKPLISSTPINESSELQEIYALISQERLEECLYVCQNQEEETRHYNSHRLAQLLIDLNIPFSSVPCLTDRVPPLGSVAHLDEVIQSLCASVQENTETIKTESNRLRNAIYRWMQKLGGPNNSQ